MVYEVLKLELNFMTNLSVVFIKANPIAAPQGKSSVSHKPIGSSL